MSKNKDEALDMITSFLQTIGFAAKMIAEDEATVVNLDCSFEGVELRLTIAKAPPEDESQDAK